MKGWWKKSNKNAGDRHKRKSKYMERNNVIVGWKTPYGWILSILLKSVYRLNAIPTKIPAEFLVDINKLILKYIWKGKETRIAKAIWKKKKSWRTHSSWFSYYKVTVIKKGNCQEDCQRNKNIDQWEQNGVLDIVPHKYDWLIFHKNAKAIQWRKDHLSIWVTQHFLGFEHPHAQRNKHWPKSHTVWKSNSKWVIDLNVKWKTIKLLEENIRESLCDLGLGKDFLGMTPKAQPNKEKNCIKFRTLL